MRTPEINNCARARQALTITLRTPPAKIAAGMIAAMIKGTTLPFHVVYLGTAISGGSLVGSWMNDAGFWVFSKIGGVTEVETLKSWTPLSAIVGTTSMIVTVLLAFAFPLK